MDLKVTTASQPPDAMVALTGELDLFSSPRLTAELTALMEAGCRRVLLDLAGVTFADAAALSALLKARKDLLEASGNLRVVAMSAAFVRLLQLTRLDAAFALGS